MMWLGCGILLALLIAAILWCGNYQRSWHYWRQLYRRHRGQCRAGFIVGCLLLVFAMGTRIDAGPITLLQYSVSDKIYQTWSAFRAAAREAWPFYYVAMLGIIYWLAHSMARFIKRPTRAPIYIALIMTAVAGIQTVDIITSPNASAKHSAFGGISRQTAEFQPLNIGGIIKRQQHLVALDEGFRGDQSGTYVMGRTALKYGLTLNIGFFARVPEQIKTTQTNYRQLLTQNKLSADDLANNFFFTKDERLVSQLENSCQLAKVDGWTFIIGWK